MLPTACLLALTVYTSEPAVKAKLLLQSDSYTVNWGEVAKFDPTAELEVAEGHDHAPWNLDWYRFRPGKDGVEVLAVQHLPWLGMKMKEPKALKDGRVLSARMQAADYEALLQALAVVDSATLQHNEESDRSFTWHHFVWQARLTANKKALLDLNWVGVGIGPEHWKSAKPEVAVRLVVEVVWSLHFEEHKLTDEDRAWVSAKLVRDWRTIKDDKSAWWVRERALDIIGKAGDASALPLLREILSEEPKDAKDQDMVKAKKHEWGWAITASAKLLGKDVRDMPVGETEVEATRKKVLELLKDVK